MQEQVTLQTLADKIDELATKIDCMTHIDIKNGGGRPVQYQRDVFFQYMYDRVTFKGWMPKVITFASFVLTILTILQVMMFFHGGK